MRRRWRQHRHHAPEMDITAFLNLMVILIPFLLITAVFSRIAIMELALPTENDAIDQRQEEVLHTEVIVRADRIVVSDRGSPPVNILKTPEGYQLDKLSVEMQRIKALIPDKTDVTILLEPDIPYDDLIQAMDTVRAAHILQNGISVNTELFPDISIGDAPPTESPAATTEQEKP